MRISDWSSDVCSSDLILTIGTHNNCDSVTHVLKVPFVLPWLAEGKFTGVELQGVNQLQEQAEQDFGPGNYRPNLFVTYWSFRAMIGLAAGSAALALAGLWVTRKGRVPDQKWFGVLRSEEHTSELQSLMRIPYAVSCFI